jgi:hypothetical protein
MPEKSSYGSQPGRTQPVKIIAPKPASTVAGALKGSQAYLSESKRK